MLSRRLLPFFFVLSAAFAVADDQPDAKKPEPKRPGAAAPVSSGDPFAMSPDIGGGGNPLFSLNANQALLTAPAAPEPPPPRVEAVGRVEQRRQLGVHLVGGAERAVQVVGDRVRERVAVVRREAEGRDAETGGAGALGESGRLGALPGAVDPFEREQPSHAA